MGFILTNKRASRRIHRHLPHAQSNLHAEYVGTVAEHVERLPPGAIVVDVGGGRKCEFARFRKAGSGVLIVAVDVSNEELAHNTDVDEKLVADITKRLPFDDAEVDMIVSRSVIEHLRDSEAFAREAARVLKPGGHFISVLPSRFAPFSIANQLLPRRLSRYLLRMLIPGSEGRLGFPAFYDRAYPSALRKLLRRTGFDVLDLRVGYCQAGYFDFFLPLYLLNVAYELVISALRLENLAANMLVVARKP